MLACLVDGEISAWLAADDRGLAYGDGLFETLVMKGGQPRFWQLHMNRLGAGCERLQITMPPQELLLLEARTVAAGQRECVVKIILTRGSGGRGYRPGNSATPRRVVTAHDLPANLAELALVGVQARTCSIRLGLQPALAGLKHLNRLEQVMAGLELADTPGEEGLLLDQAGYINSALSGNLFLVSDDRLLTPRMDRCGVHGVVRALVLRDHKTRIELRRVHPNMLSEASEVFITNSVRGVLPVTGIDERRWPVGSFTRAMQDWFTQISEAS
jgi:4-amino-4-deoxychorismate lyase